MLRLTAARNKLGRYAYDSETVPEVGGYHFCLDTNSHKCSLRHAHCQLSVSGYSPAACRRNPYEVSRRRFSSHSDMVGLWLRWYSTDLLSHWLTFPSPARGHTVSDHGHNMWSDLAYCTVSWVAALDVCCSLTIADVYANPASNQAAKDAALIAFQALHQYGGVIIGEHIGQLFTVVWMFLVSAAMMKSTAFRPWLGWFGIIGGVIYLFAQLELFATVIPGIPVISIAGLLGSLLWLIWLILIGITMLRKI